MQIIQMNYVLGFLQHKRFYTATSSTIADAFLNDEPIYTNSALTTTSSTGFYTDTIGTTNYRWDSLTGWGEAFPC
jgi:hypothetical protein